MGSLYRLGQKFVDFCNVVQQNINNALTVPSSKVLYDVTNEIMDALPYNLAGTATALNSYIQIPQTAQVLVARVLLPDSALAWTTVILPSMLTSSARTYAVGGSGSTTNALWGADLQATSSAICLTRVTAAGAAASNFQLALYYR